MHTVTKSYRDLPAAHRQPNHDGCCRFIHGHNWGFDITFEAEELDENGFVVDVGKLRWIRDWLEDHFDHTLLLNIEDPHVDYLRCVLEKIKDTVIPGGVGEEDVPIGMVPFAQIVLVPNCGMEGLAECVHVCLNGILVGERGGDHRSVKVVEVVCWEDGKNCARYRP